MNHTRKGSTWTRTAALWLIGGVAFMPVTQWAGEKIIFGTAKSQTPLGNEPKRTPTSQDALGKLSLNPPSPEPVLVPAVPATVPVPRSSRSLYQARVEERRNWAFVDPGELEAEAERRASGLTDVEEEEDANVPIMFRDLVKSRKDQPPPPEALARARRLWELDANDSELDYSGLDITGRRRDRTSSGTDSLFSRTRSGLLSESTSTDSGALNREELVNAGLRQDLLYDVLSGRTTLSAARQAMREEFRRFLNGSSETATAASGWTGQRPAAGAFAAGASDFLSSRNVITPPAAPAPSATAPAAPDPFASPVARGSTFALKPPTPSAAARPPVLTPPPSAGARLSSPWMPRSRQPTQLDSWSRSPTPAAAPRRFGSSFEIPRMPGLNSLGGH